jgi:hypothetical protein
MEMTKVKTDAVRCLPPDTRCPFNGNTQCTASLSMMEIDTYQKERWCCTDDFDACPIFLAKMLRKR